MPITVKYSRGIYSPLYKPGSDIILGSLNSTPEHLQKINDSITLSTSLRTMLSDFYKNNIQESSRSIMNIPFSLEDESLNLKFLEDASKAGLLALKGHRSVGGMRASIYNAMPEEGVDSLIDFMTSFEKENF